MGRTIVVSDLHVDTWRKDRKVAGADNRNMTMLEYFEEFIGWCLTRGVERFIIAGDLMDSPAGPRTNVFTGPNPIGKEVLNRLEKLAQTIQVNYVVGNHDIALNELRFLGIKHVPLMPSVSLCYPGYIIDTYKDELPDTDTGEKEKTIIMVDHGHLCDPAMGMYEDDLSHTMYYSGPQSTSTWPHIGAEAAKPTAMSLIGSTALPPIPIPSGKTAYEAARAGADDSTPSTGGLSSLWAHGGFLDKATREARRRWWWSNGLDQMEGYLESQKPNITRMYLIQGHTHLIDVRKPVDRQSIACSYINAGTWQQGYGTAGYVDIDGSGHCWLQDWIREPLSIKNKAPKHPI